MAANVNDSTNEMTFLYKFLPGLCPASHGHNVAKIAGLPEKAVFGGFLGLEISARSKGAPETKMRIGLMSSLEFRNLYKPYKSSGQLQIYGCNIGMY